MLSGAADAGAGGIELTVLESTAAASAGVRAGRGMTTYYVRTRVDAFDAGASVPGVSLRFEGGRDVPRSSS